MNQLKVQFCGVDLNLDQDFPSTVLQNIACNEGLNIASEGFAKYLDANDYLSHLRDEFIIPEIKHETKHASAVSTSYAYFAGNKVGLQPSKTADFVMEILERWGKTGVECHFGNFGAATCEDYVETQIARLVGAKNSEVTVMNDVETNLHLMLVSFYRPIPTRHKILMDSNDVNRPILETQIENQGYNVEESLIFIDYKPGKYTLDVNDIFQAVEEHEDSIATIFLPCILPISGQLLDVERITKLGHEKGCMVGFSMDDAVGNVELHLNKWEVDFACWSSSKYLNAGPQAIGCAFIHEKHAENNWPKFQGWWGHKYSSRFQMTNKMESVPGVKGYRLSNQSPILLAPLKVSLDLFDKTSLQELMGKSFLLTGYLEHLIKLNYPKPEGNHDGKIGVDVLTPCSSRKRGCQLSLKLTRNMKQVQNELKKLGFICHCFPPDILTVCPAPLYCRFYDVFNFVAVLQSITEYL